MSKKGDPSYKWESTLPNLQQLRFAVSYWLDVNKLTLQEFAYQIGWHRTDPDGKIRGDTSRIKRALGIDYPKKTIKRNIAEQITIAINRDIREFE